VKKIRAFFLEAWRQAGPDALGWAGANQSNIQEISSEDFISSLLSQPEAKVIAFSENERIVGIAVIRKIDQNSVELAGIIVQEDAKGKGIGTKLLKMAIDSAKELGFRTVHVKTETNNRNAISFYKKNGFIDEGLGEENVEGKIVKVKKLGYTITPRDELL
jgi:ribosomal protein S18 acetylase RimI-like enzyme